MSPLFKALAKLEVTSADSLAVLKKKADSATKQHEDLHTIIHNHALKESDKSFGFKTKKARDDYVEGDNTQGDKYNEHVAQHTRQHPMHEKLGELNKAAVHARLAYKRAARAK